MELKEGYKQTELGIIPEDWEVKELRNYFSYISYGFTNPMPTVSSGIYMITANDIKNGIINFKTARKTSFDAYRNLITDKSRPKPNDILLTKDGTLGRLAIVGNEKICINQSVAVIRPNEKVNPVFLKRLLESSYYQKTMLLNAKGSTIKHIYITIVDKMKMGIPSTIEEQKAIAQVLSDTDNLIEAIKQKLTKKRAIKQGAMQQLLTPKENWEVKELGELIHSFQNGYGFSASGYVDNGTPIVTMAQIGLDGSFKFNENKVNYWQKKDFNILKNYHLKNGDLIIAMTDVTPDKNLIGRMSIVKTNKILLLNQRVGLLRIDKDKINPFFLKTYSNMENWRDYCIGSASLGVQANIGTKDILKGLIQLPNIEEQTEIATILSDMDAEIEQLEQKLSKYKMVKQGLMQNLLTGKIRLV